jgi:hypothetical protein
MDIDSDDSDDEGTKVQVKTLMRQQAEEQRQRHAEQTQLLNMIRELEGRLNASGAANNPGTATTGFLGTALRPGQVKVPKPDLFYGDRAKFDNWALQVDLYLRFNPAPTNEDAALLAAMYLRGRAEQWIKKFVKQKFEGTETSGILDSWAQFRQACEQMFGNTTEVTDAARIIQLQRQTGSVRDYAAKFMEFAVVLD